MNQLLKVTHLKAHWYEFLRRATGEPNKRASPESTQKTPMICSHYLQVGNG